MTPEVALTPEAQADLEVALLGWAQALIVLAGAGRDAQHDDEVQVIPLSSDAAAGQQGNGYWPSLEQLDREGPDAPARGMPALKKWVTARWAPGEGVVKHR